ncbi:hypothetical protein N9996_03910 [Synechococcus sp. AH-603-M21]|nr:hypothetical protein [Synechococcus sp. AH-603-M21]
MSKSYSPPQIWNEEKKREELVRRMIRAYNKNKNKKKDRPEQSKPTQSELRKRKLEDLNSRADSWKGLK